MHNVLTVLAQEADGAHGGVALPFDPIWFGVIALGILLALLAILWQFRHAVPMNPEDQEFAADHIRHRQNQRATPAGRR
ncbi:hypothetical protein [Kytococcus sedentarius]|uniref:hypothetical protein n=1 Tax=Kytococcus sedentarius TaxID=1276 RepID=UPI0035BC877A